MTKIKVYTEEQVRQMLIKITNSAPLNIDYLINEITPIELPNDEEISKESMDLYWGDGNSLNHILQYKAFKRGAYWMRYKIQGSGQ